MPDWLLVFIALFAFIAVGVPIPMSIGVSALVGFWLVDIPVITLAQSAYMALNNVPIMAVPLFVLAGALMERGGLADRLVRFAQSLVGNYDGALGIVAVVILGGIYGGAFTPTEAAAVAVFYALLTGLVIYRELTWQGIVESLRLTTLICGAIVIMLGPAIAFGQLGALMQIPEQIGALMGGLADQPLTVLLVVTVVFVITGTFMDSIAQIILFTPLFLPLATQAGVDPITLGIIIVLTCEIGFLTPPVGANLFVAMRLARVPLGAVSVAVLPFLLAYFAIVAVVTFAPQVALWLPHFMDANVR